MKLVANALNGVSTTDIVSFADSDELSFAEGDCLELVEKEDDDWWRARDALLMRLPVGVGQSRWLHPSERAAKR